MEKQFLRIILILSSNLWLNGRADEGDLRNPLLIPTNKTETVDSIPTTKGEDTSTPSTKDSTENVAGISFMKEKVAPTSLVESTSASSKVDTDSVLSGGHIPTEKEDTSHPILTIDKDAAPPSAKSDVAESLANIQIENAPGESSTEKGASSVADTSSAKSTDDTPLPLIDAPRSASSSVSRREYAKGVSLVSVFKRTDYDLERTSIVSQFTHIYRRKICDMTYEVRDLTNQDLDSFIFDTHLYEFELENGQVHISVGLHCPTKGFPQVFLRVPPSSDEDLKLVLVRREYYSQEIFYRLGAADSVTPALEENEVTARLRKSPILGYDLEKRWEFCDSVRNRFKYTLLDEHYFVEEAAIYKFQFNNEEEFHLAIKCPFSVTMYICFVTNSSEIRMVFLNEIRSLIENNRLLFKPNLMNALVKHKLHEESWFKSITAFIYSIGKLILPS